MLIWFLARGSKSAKRRNQQYQSLGCRESSPPAPFPPPDSSFMYLISLVFLGCRCAWPHGWPHIRCALAFTGETSCPSTATALRILLSPQNSHATSHGQAPGYPATIPQLRQFSCPQEAEEFFDLGRRPRGGNCLNDARPFQGCSQIFWNFWQVRREAGPPSTRSPPWPGRTICSQYP